MKDRTFQNLFRWIGIGIAVLCTAFCIGYIYACYETAWGEFGMFLLPLVVGVPFITLESITFSIKFFLKRSSQKRAFVILKGIELALSVSAVFLVVLAFCALSQLMLPAILFASVIPALWIAEIILKKH